LLSVVTRNWKGGEFCYSLIREKLDQPVSMENLTSEWLGNKFGFSQHFSLFLFAVLTWAIWNHRNQMSMQSKFPNHCVDVLFDGMSNL
jgi:hypothetical protein